MPTVAEAGTALRDALAVFKELDLPVYLDGGTLLGFYRDGHFAEDDHDDVDLTIPAWAWQQHETINEAMLAKGFTLYHKWDRDEVEHHSGQYAWKRGEVKIDLMYKEIKDGKIWWTVYGGARGITYKAVPAEYVLGEEGTAPGGLEISIPGTTEREIVQVPTKTEKYLAYRYGEWQEPVHRTEYSCYTTDKAILEPNTYETI